MSNKYDTFVEVVSDLKEDTELVLFVRDLTPKDIHKKYFTKKVKALVSSDPKKYKDSLSIRFNRGGGLYPETWSIDTIENLDLLA